jgi:hypothetical protein
MFQNTGPVSVPAGGTIGLSAVVLAGVQCFENQADYKAAVGMSPPAWDPSLPIKLWRDTNAARTNVNSANPWAGYTYNFVVRDSMLQNGVLVYGDAVIEQGEMPGWLAARVNIPPDGSSGAGVSPTYQNPDQVFPIDPSITQAQVIQSPFGVELQGPISIP